MANPKGAELIGLIGVTKTLVYTSGLNVIDPGLKDRILSNIDKIDGLVKELISIKKDGRQ